MLRGVLPLLLAGGVRRHEFIQDAAATSRYTRAACFSSLNLLSSSSSSSSGVRRLTRESGSGGSASWEGVRLGVTTVATPGVSRGYGTTTAPRRAPKTHSGGTTTAVDGENPFEFEFDPMAGVQHDAAVESAKKSLSAIVEELAPPNAPPEALAKIQSYLQVHPVDSLIVHAIVQITNIEDAATGMEDKVHLSPMPTSEALEQARLRKMNLVQMGSRGDELAYCRIRRERPRVWKLVQAEMELVGEAVESVSPDAATLQPGEGAPQPSTAGGVDSAASQRPRQYIGRTKELIDHAFRDAVDAHFVGWRSKKVVQDIRKGHAVKLTIRDFQSPEAAINKLREMCHAMKAYAEEERIYHHFTSIVANDREASITFSPPAANKSGTITTAVKHPSEKEWAGALKRMEGACEKVGRIGTYVKSNKLKMRRVGATTYRVDKYGRRLD